MRTILMIFAVVSFYTLKAQQVPVLNFNEAQKIWTNTSDTVYLVNYWATWCKPCVEELPDFIKLNKELKNKKFKMILITLDFPQHIENRVKPFIHKNKIEAKVVLLDDDANVWINMVNKDWDGSIPVTQIIQNGTKEFYDGILNYNELKKIVEPKLVY